MVQAAPIFGAAFIFVGMFFSSFEKEEKNQKKEAKTRKAKRERHAQSAPKRRARFASFLSLCHGTGVTPPSSVGGFEYI